MAVSAPVFKCFARLALFVFLINWDSLNNDIGYGVSSYFKLSSLDISRSLMMRSLLNSVCESKSILLSLIRMVFFRCESGFILFFAGNFL